MSQTCKPLFLLAVVFFAAAAVLGDHHGGGHGSHDEHDEMFKRLDNLERATRNLTETTENHAEDLKDIKGILELLHHVLVPADADSKKHLLLTAAKDGNALLARIVLKSGVDTEATNDQKYTALHLAAQNGHTEVVRALIKANANTEAEGGDKQETPWDLAVLNDRKDTARELLALKTLDENERNLLNAAKTGSKVQVDSLARRAVSLEVRDPENHYQTPLILAAANGRRNVVRALLEAKANIEARDLKGQTALHVAAANGLKDVVEELLKNNADVTAKDALGWSPEGAAFKYPDIKKMLSVRKTGKSTGSQL